MALTAAVNDAMNLQERYVDDVRSSEMGRCRNSF
jgi:hypothetical protein